MSEKSPELKAVCKEIDQLLLQFMDKMESYQSFHGKCIGHMKSGYLAITKARLNTGDINVKSDLTLEPLTAVACDFLPLDEKKIESEGRYSHRRVAYDASSSYSRSQASTDSPSRRRVVHEDIRDAESSSTVEETVVLEKTDGKLIDKDDLPKPTRNIAMPNDPFTAFAFMARNPLKPAQNQFNSALSYIIEAADAAQEIMQLERQYKQLLEKKKALLKGSS